MKVYIDGESVKIQNDVRIVYDIIENDQEAELHVIATSEGLIYDVINNGEVIATMCSLAQDLVDDVIG
jgi:hypothetical protein